MIKWSVRAALVLSASSVALVAAVLPAQAAPAKGWRIVSSVSAGRGTAEELTGIDAVGPGDAWTIGFSAATHGSGSGLNHLKPVIKHWNGKSWHLVRLPGRVATAWAKDEPILAPVAASSARNVWAFASLSGPGAHYLRLKGSRWTTGKIAGTTASPVEVLSARAFGNSDVWVFGTRFNSGTATSKPYAGHFNGHAWSSVPVPGSGVIESVSSPSSRSIWAVVNSEGGTPAATVVHWTPSTGWKAAAVQPVLPDTADLSSIAAEPDGTVWIGGTSGTAPFAAELVAHASAWTAATLPAGTGGKNWTISGLATDGDGGLWALSTDEGASGQPQRLLRLQGSAWSLVKPAFGSHEWLLWQIAAVPHTSSVWGVGVQRRGSGGNGLIAVAGPTPR